MPYRRQSPARGAGAARRRLGRARPWHGAAAGAGGGDPENVLTEALVLRDPEIPVAGNADGDVTIVEYFDYNCPYCRKLEPELRQVVHDDGKVRLIWKDWPILGPVSVVATRMALASKYQDKYVKAHEALIGVSSKLTEPRIKRIAGRRRHRYRPAQPRPCHQRQGDRRHHRAQQRSGRRVRLQGHAVLHRRQIPRAGHADHGGIRARSLPMRARRRREEPTRVNSEGARKQKRPRRGTRGVRCR